MAEHYMELSEMVSEGRYQEAKSYCQNEIQPTNGDEEYENLKSKAMEATEIWGDESDYWFQALPKAAAKNDDEWRFVLANYLLSVVKECKTSGDVKDDSLICFAAHEVFQSLDFADRHEHLALSLYHQKLGHLANSNGEFEASVEHFETALETINEADGLGGWHHHALCIRDLAKAQSLHYRQENNHLEAVQSLENWVEELEQINCSSSSRFQSQLEATEHDVRAEMADIIGKESRKKRHRHKSQMIRSEAK